MRDRLALWVNLVDWKMKCTPLEVVFPIHVHHSRDLVTSTPTSRIYFTFPPVVEVHPNHSSPQIHPLSLCLSAVPSLVPVSVLIIQKHQMAPLLKDKEDHQVLNLINQVDSHI